MAGWITLNREQVGIQQTSYAVQYNTKLNENGSKIVQLVDMGSAESRGEFNMENNY
jgi:hypothetical protein